MNHIPEYIPEWLNRAVSYAASIIRKEPEVEVSDEQMVSIVKGALGAYGAVLAGESVRISLKNEDVNKVLTDYSVISSLYQQSLGSLQKDLVLMGKSQFDHTLEIHLTGEELKLMNEISEVLALKSHAIREDLISALKDATGEGKVIEEEGFKILSEERTEVSSDGFRKASKYQPYSTKVEVRVPYEETSSDEIALIMTIKVTGQEKKSVKFDIPWGDAKPELLIEVTAEQFCRYLWKKLSGDVDESCFEGLAEDQQKALVNMGDSTLQALDESISDLLLAGMKNEELAFESDSLDKRVEIFRAKVITNIDELVRILGHQETIKVAAEMKTLKQFVESLKGEDYQLLQILKPYLESLNVTAVYVGGRVHEGEVVDLNFPAIKENQVATYKLLDFINEHKIRIDGENAQELISGIMEKQILDFLSPSFVFTLVEKFDLNSKEVKSLQEDIVASKEEMTRIIVELESVMELLKEAKQPEDITYLDLSYFQTITKSFKNDTDNEGLKNLVEDLEAMVVARIREKVDALFTVDDIFNCSDEIQRRLGGIEKFSSSEDFTPMMECDFASLLKPLNLVLQYSGDDRLKELARETIISLFNRLATVEGVKKEEIVFEDKIQELLVPEKKTEFLDITPIKTDYGIVNVPKGLENDFNRAEFIINETERFGINNKERSIKEFLEYFLENGCEKGNLERFIRFSFQSIAADTANMTMMYEQLFPLIFEKGLEDTTLQYHISLNPRGNLELVCSIKKSMDHEGVQIGFGGSTEIRFHGDRYEMGDVVCAWEPYCILSPEE
ncbi:MAG: hypothetical protein K940chlam3_00759 [Chlamydiae bacterium]|nr:hypothetical protein [Chlamydiota bacterium]